MGLEDPADYDDFWIVYGSKMDYPVADENLFDFMKVNAVIKAVDELKKAIE